MFNGRPAMNHLDTPLGQVIREMQEGLKPHNPPRLGDYATNLMIDGLDVVVSYDLVGEYYKGDAINPPEYPCAEIVTVQIGDTTLTGKNAAAWDDRLELTLLVEEQLERAGL
jgi:hypothetical protein